MVVAAVAGLVGSMVIAAPPAVGQQDVVFSNDFEAGEVGGWFGRGTATVAVSTDQAHSGTASLLTTGRTDSWNGPGHSLLGVLLPGATYEIEAFVRMVEGAHPVTMTVQRRPAGGTDQFDTIAFQVPASDQDWVRVAGSYTFSTDPNEELQLYLESPDVEADFYVDDVTIVQTSPPPGGGDQVILAADFETGTAEGWGARGEETVAASDADAHGGSWSLLASGRTEPWNGPSRDITALVEPGTTYRFSLWLKLAAGQEPAELRVSVQQDFAEADSTFTTVVSDTTVTADEWVQFTGGWTPSPDAIAIHVYAESASALVDFHLDDFEMTVPAPPDIEDIPPLKDVLADHFPIGAAIDLRETVGPSAELLTKHFNAITAENDMKPAEIQPTEGQFTFEDADALVEFAEANNLRVYGHTLVWHSQTPEWFWQDENGEPLTNSPEHRQLALDRMQAHIQAIADRYRDQVWAFDVVNEVIDESQPDGLRRSPWYNIIGPDYVAQAFHFAREAFGPDVKLFINDFNTEFPAKRDALYALVEQLRGDGVPVDGVGHQLHLSLNRPVSLVDQTITKFRELGVLQAVTELDVAISASSQEQLPAPPPDRVIRQGYYYRDLFEILRNHSDVLESVTVWGLHDGRSWLRDREIPRPHEAPLFFDDRLQAKPAYWGVVDPTQLPHLPQTHLTRNATPVVDGDRELVWDQLPAISLAEGIGFQVRWDSEQLYALVEVTDDTVDAGDRVDLFVDDTNAKAGEYGPGDAHYSVGRDGSTSGDPTAAVVTETDTGYRVEVALPLATPGALDRQVGFDVRVTEGGTGDRFSWSDQNHEQDTDTSRWGTLTFIDPVGHVDVPETGTAPVIDGQIEAGWQDAAAVTTEVLVEGSADGAKGTFRLLWDEQTLYVLAEVTDPQLNADNSNAWEQDSIEIFLDPGNTKSGGFKSTDGQYRINYLNHQSISGDPAVIGDNLTSAAAVVDGGYVIEAAVAIEGGVAGPGAFVGLELQVNDATDGTRTAVHTWHDPTGQSFQDTSRWGVARLVAAPEPPEPTCDRTVTGAHLGSLTVRDGLTCLDGALVLGSVKVRPGASLIATDSTVVGSVTGDDPALLVLTGGVVVGQAKVTGASDRLELAGNQVLGLVTLTGNQTGETPIVVSANTILGLLSCTANQPAPVNNGAPNTVYGVKLGQCRTL
ncbi:MAG TPA: endo-1,4-beta-xylanase [Natronosporangium sp.]